ncbi:uncharacterized protein IL334_001771 [Kwoniella shivajii]|uniref:Zn(2)-C6 fungal-type domain-containing protein n=1 Tax=Kwoniella shivajii TaxID=564305 RepID=A0ABZ1CUF6_9TREE|nr:hypothetical protein IL334_001771 [Kwoniella shivajii]
MAGPSSQPFNLESLFGPTPTPIVLDDGDNVDTPGGHNQLKRGKTGCITCRLRKKRCDEAKPICATCSRLGIECMGYGAKRPKWLKEKDNAKKAKQNIKQTVLSKRSNKGRQASSTDSDRRDQSVAPSIMIDDTAASNDPSQDDQDRTMVLDTQMEMTDNQNFWNLASSSSNTALGWNISPTTTNTTGTGGEMTEQTFQTNSTALSNGYADPSYSGMITDPSVFPPIMETNGPVDLGALIPSIPSMNDMSMDALWGILFGPQPPPEMNNTTENTTNPITHDTPLFTLPSPSPGLSPDTTPNIVYLHHYLNVVLPIQYRIMGISISMGDFVAPLALQRTEVLTSVSSLAALHMVAQRTKRRPRNMSPIMPRISLFNEYEGSATLTNIDDDEDADAKVAAASHHKTMERLRFISPQDLTAEEIIVSVLFAVSYHLFCGGTSKHLKELLAILQRCLSAALYSSPELQGDASKAKKMNGPSPWSRYRLLIEHMIWSDIINSVTQNKASSLLPMYRRLLDHLPSGNPAPPNRPTLLMDRLMGCDSTTLLAMCETIALSEWKDRAEAAGCLSYKELLDRAATVEKILDERAWRESHLDQPSTEEEEPTADSASVLRRVMSDVFHGSAKVLLAVTLNGPFPRVPEIAAAVADTMEALNRLDIQHPNVQIHRAVVLPITLAGCHCETLAQQAYFRQCFECLGPEAKAFGNTGPALELMEEVWRKRALAGPNVKVDWRQTMYDLGWEAGILLI